MNRSHSRIRNKDTGEILAGYFEILPPTHLDPEKIEKAILNKGGSSFDTTSIFWKQKEQVLDDEEDQLTEDVTEKDPKAVLFGSSFFEQTSSSKHTKIFQVIGRPNFSRITYEAYWYRLLYHLDRDTNALYYRRRNAIFLITNKDMLRRICQVKERTFRGFYQECKARKYIAEFTTKGATYFIINPKYARNGNRSYEYLTNLFHPEGSVKT